MFVQSKACCTRPPVVLAGGYTYAPKGKYVSYSGIETYETGASTATRGILVCYDVFGLYIQTIRGADILASGYPPLNDNAGNFKVFMPDFFGDSPSDLSKFPPKTPAEIKFITDFMSGPANPDKTVPLISPLMEAIKKAHPHIESWAIHGFCWGGKIAAIVSQPGSLFKASGQSHPSLLDIEDAKKVSIPMVVLPSMDEDPEAMEIWAQALKAASPNSYCETFTDQVHGWMTSRADFNNLHAFEEYLRGYRIVRSFFAQHI